MCPLISHAQCMEANNSHVAFFQRLQVELLRQARLTTLSNIQNKDFFEE